MAQGNRTDSLKYVYIFLSYTIGDPYDGIRSNPPGSNLSQKDYPRRTYLTS